MRDDDHCLVRGIALQSPELMFRSKNPSSWSARQGATTADHKHRSSNRATSVAAARQRFAALADQRIETCGCRLTNCDNPASSAAATIAESSAYGAPMLMFSRRCRRRAGPPGRQSRRYAAGRPEVRLAQVDAVDANGALRWRMEAENELLQGRLAGTGATDDDHVLAGLDAEGDIFSAGSAWFRIGESDVANSISPANSGAVNERLFLRPFDRLAISFSSDSSAVRAFWYCISRPTA